MSKLTEIENRIVQLDAAGFSKFCDTVLSKKEEYGNITGLGMKSGTLKTTVGNPDTYFARDNGKYVFVAYTTQQTNIYKKLKEDIEKCLDEKKTGVQISDIEEIVCCHTSSNLSAGHDKELKEMCKALGIRLTILGADELAQQVYSRYPIIARDFLGVSIDTNQIMSVKDFIDLYDSSETAAPLKTKFQSRQELFNSLKSLIMNNSAVIVHGSAGVGKTRLVIETIKEISIESGYQLLCVKNNNLEIYEDLTVCFERPGKYLVFIDDANELAGLNLIMSFVCKDNPDYQIKAVMTVRDYVKLGVIQEVSKFVVPQMLEVPVFTDNEIKEFIRENMGILNEDFLDIIIRIAEGNPRVAYMAGRVALETESLAAVHDATQVYEKYYGQIIGQKLGNDRCLCFSAGILSIIKAIRFDDLACLEEILKMGKIPSEEFIECVRRLATMEVVEIYADRVAVLSDQCMANYMLYYEFFEQKRIPFSSVLLIGFRHFRNGVIESMNTLLNLFYREDLHEYIASEVKNAWKELEENSEPCFLEFAKCFHVFQPEKGLEIGYNQITEIKGEEYRGESIDFEKSVIDSDLDILEYFTGYKHSKYFPTVVESILMYASKSKKHAVTAYGWLKNNLSVDVNSARVGYDSEKALANQLLKNLHMSEITDRFIIAVIAHMLSFEFRTTEMGRGKTFLISTIQLINSENVKAYRQICWNVLDQMIDQDMLISDIYQMIDKYANSIRYAKDPSIIEDDKPYIEGIVSRINCSMIQKTFVNRKLCFGWKERGVDFVEEQPESDEWKVCLLLEDRWEYSGLEYEDYKLNRSNRIKSYATELPIEGINKFVQATSLVLGDVEESEKYGINEGLQQALQVFGIDPDKAMEAFVAIMKEGMGIDVSPRYLFDALFQANNPLEIWTLLGSYEFAHRNAWQYEYFRTIPQDKIDDEIYHTLLVYLKDNADGCLQSSPYRSLVFLEKFISIDPNIFVTASRIIYAKRSYSPFIVRIYFEFLFNDAIYAPERIAELFASDLLLLKDIFFYVMQEGNYSIDYKGHFLAHFISMDISWMDAFANVVIEKIKHGSDQNHNHYNAIWHEKRYIECFDVLFERISGVINELYDWRVADAFKSIMSHKNGDAEIIRRQEEWTVHIVEKYSNDTRIPTVFVALSEANAEIRRKAFECFFAANSDYDTFETLQLDPDHWGGDVSVIVHDLQQRIDFLESLLELTTGVKFIQHSVRIRERIELWKNQIKREETESIYRKINR